MWMRIPQPTDLSVFWMRPSQLADWLSGRSKAHTRYDANRVGRVLTEKGYPKTTRKGQVGYKVVLMDYDEAERRLKQLAVMPEEAKEETKEEEVKDITDLSQDVQTMYRRLLGEKDEDEE
jgi:outer membrane biogenesis lipoprotein LolB